MNSTLQAEQRMNTSVINYPGFQTLPKAVKKMLLVSEAHFFEQPAPHPQEQRVLAQEIRSNQGLRSFLVNPLMNMRIPLAV
jgi:hypothetical protein